MNSWFSLKTSSSVSSNYQQCEHCRGSWWQGVCRNPRGCWATRPPPLTNPAVFFLIFWPVYKVVTKIFKYQIQYVWHLRVLRHYIIWLLCLFLSETKLEFFSFNKEYFQTSKGVGYLTCRKIIAIQLGEDAYRALRFKINLVLPEMDFAQEALDLARGLKHHKHPGKCKLWPELGESCVARGCRYFKHAPCYFTWKHVHTTSLA